MLSGLAEVGSPCRQAGVGSLQHRGGLGVRQGRQHLIGGQEGAVGIFGAVPGGVLGQQNGERMG